MVMMTTSHLLALLALCAEATSFAPHPAFTTPRCSPSSSQLHVAAASVGAVTTENLNLLSERGRDAILSLIQNDPHGAQAHVYGGWPQAGVEDEGKKQLADQLADLDASYPGGLNAYLTKAKWLLKESADGLNPFSEFEALVPHGESLDYETTNYAELEALGKTVMKDCVFVLVAGGLGERLGYSGIKVSLESDLLSQDTYLETYVNYIRAMQDVVKEETGETVNIPLIIMTSGDTDPLTRKLLAEHNNYGMDIRVVVQDKVPALKDGQAGLAMDNKWQVQTKPHGHGDVHHLLLREGIVDEWVTQKKKYVCFLQDTNALVINSILSTLGVSVKNRFDMNSICIPRLAGEAAGAIARLEHKTDPEKSLTINVEYNQLDPLLRTQGDCLGDVADPATGYSPFPGNANNFVIEMGAYAKTLAGKDQGVVVEFVNPKYNDDTRTEFKKPTRLECMMQDIPKLFQKEIGKNAKIGFTMYPRWITFSPAKNALEEGVSAVKKGSTAPGTMSSAESDKYIQNQRKLKYAGVDLHPSTPDDLVPVGGIPLTPGPRVHLSSSFSLTQQDVMTKVTGGKISVRSSLIVDGAHIQLRNLDLDGALVIKAANGCDVLVDGLKVQNKGWTFEELEGEHPEPVAIRGYTLVKHETAEYIINEPGKYVIGEDGVVTKVD